MKKLHQPHHKIPTVDWKHWNKKSEAVIILLEELKEKECSSSQSSQQS